MNSFYYLLQKLTSTIRIRVRDTSECEWVKRENIDGEHKLYKHGLVKIAYQIISFWSPHIPIPYHVQGFLRNKKDKTSWHYDCYFLVGPCM